MCGTKPELQGTSKFEDRINGGRDRLRKREGRYTVWYQKTQRNRLLRTSSDTGETSSKLKVIEDFKMAGF